MKRLIQTPLNPEVLRYLQEIATFNERWKVVNTSPDFYSDLKKTTIITSAGASTRIEGAHLSDKEILKRLDGIRIQKIQDRDEAEVAGYIDSMKYIFDQFRELAISEHTIRSLHQMMCQYLSHDILPPNQRGVYKNITNAVIRVDPSTGSRETMFETTPPGPQTETAMRELVEDYTHFIEDPNFSDLEVIAAFIVKFLAIHPFRDGNGRISRLLTTLCLLQQGYEFSMFASHEKIIEENKDQYYVALRQTQATFKDSPDLNPWFLFFLKVLEKQTDFLEGKLMPKKLGRMTALEDKVLKLIQAHQPVSIGFLERESKIKRVTLKNILSRLKQQGVIEMSGERKGSSYKLATSL